MEHPLNYLVAQLFYQDWGILSPEVTNSLVHGVLKRFYILHQIGVLACWHEQGQNVEIGAAL